MRLTLYTQKQVLDKIDEICAQYGDIMDEVLLVTTHKPKDVPDREDPEEDTDYYSSEEEGKKGQQQEEPKPGTSKGDDDVAITGHKKPPKKKLRPAGKLAPVLPELELTEHLTENLFAHYGIDSTRQALRVISYLEQNHNHKMISVRGEGACQFSSLRMCTSQFPEYKDEHQRRDILMALLLKFDFYFPGFFNHVLGTCGHIRLSPDEYKEKKLAKTLTDSEREDFYAKGPFSMREYLLYMANPTGWGDHLTLQVYANQHMLRITSLNAETLIGTPINHRRKTFGSDIILVHAGGRHFVPACE